MKKTTGRSWKNLGLLFITSFL